MDGENTGKPYFLMDDFGGVPPTILGNTLPFEALEPTAHTGNSSSQLCRAATTIAQSTKDAQAAAHAQWKQHLKVLKRDVKICSGHNRAFFCCWKCSTKY